MATFLDWQGPGEIKCKVEAPDLFEGAVELLYSGSGPNPNEYVFTGSISNELSAPPGEYDVLLAAWDINVGNHIFKEATAVVPPFDLWDITPLDLNFPPNDISVQGNYAYLAAEYAGLHIIDISDPANPYWVNVLLLDDGHNTAEANHVVGEYAYVAP